MGQGTLGVIKMSRYRTTMAEALQKVYETPEGFALVSKAKEIAKKFANNMTKAVAEIEKLEKGLSKNSSVRDALQKANESLEEGKMKDIFTADQEGKSAAEIAKIMKLPLATVKKILGESTEEELSEFTNKMIQDLKKAYSTLPARISTDQANALSRHLDRLDLVSLKKLTKEKIPFITTLARNKIYKKTGKFEEFLNEDDIPAIDKDNAPGVKIAKIRAMDKEDGKEKDKSKDTIASLKDQIQMLKTKLENEKNKAVKPEPNPETGEVPLTIGLAHKLLRDKEKKEDVQEADLSKPQIKKVHKMADELPKKDFKDRYGKEKGDAVRYATATNIIKKKEGIKEDKADMMFKKLSQRAQTYVNELLRSGMGTMEAIQNAKDKFNEGVKEMSTNEEKRLYVEKIAALQKKADKSGMPYGILKKVYDRGMAAWKGGHRPGASQHQWAFARVNSFVTKSSGTWGGADKDLAAKVKGSK